MLPLTSFAPSSLVRYPSSLCWRHSSPGQDVCILQGYIFQTYLPFLRHFATTLTLAFLETYVFLLVSYAFIFFNFVCIQLMDDIATHFLFMCLVNLSLFVTELVRISWILPLSPWANCYNMLQVWWLYCTTWTRLVSFLYLIMMEKGRYFGFIPFCWKMEHFVPDI